MEAARTAMCRHESGWALPYRLGRDQTNPVIGLACAYGETKSRKNWPRATRPAGGAGLGAGAEALGGSSSTCEPDEDAVVSRACPGSKLRALRRHRLLALAEA
jgi:hypothetical protein